MLPGTALGVLVGDLWFTWMAFRLARRTGRSDVTAMPLGIDTPSVFGMVFFVLGPAFLAAKQAGLEADQAADHAWQIGMCTVLASGVLKLICATASAWVRSVVPRAGLLGSLAADRKIRTRCRMGSGPIGMGTLMGGLARETGSARRRDCFSLDEPS